MFNVDNVLKTPVCLIIYGELVIFKVCVIGIHAYGQCFLIVSDELHLHASAKLLETNLLCDKVGL